MAGELARLVGLDWKVRACTQRRVYPAITQHVALLRQFRVTAATDEVDAVGSSFVQLNLKLQRSDRCGALARQLHAFSAR